MSWKNELKKNIHTIRQLKEYTYLSGDEEKRLKEIMLKHPMSITRYYASLIDWSDPDDPIKHMVMPQLGEMDMHGTYDTSGEAENTKMSGLQHKYEQTALILSTNKCTSYCRHCFRKRMVGLSTGEILRRFTDAVEYIKKNTQINNVLITGGDPFILSTATINKFLKSLSGIKHLKFIRFGTRVPVTFPERIASDGKLLKLLKKYSFKHRRIYVVTQFNHPREITTQTIEAVSKLIENNVIINNQTVLLKHINDDPAILADLQNKLVSIGVNPYYVFQCRPVKRVSREFQIPLSAGIKIVEKAKTMLNGHSKRFKYIMSHKSGKIEILGILGKEIILKYHQAKKAQNIGKIFKKKLDASSGWLDELK